VRTTHFPDRVRDSIAGRRCHDRAHFSDERSEHDSQQSPVRRSPASNSGTSAARSRAKAVEAGSGQRSTRSTSCSPRVWHRRPNSATRFARRSELSRTHSHRGTRAMSTTTSSRPQRRPTSCFRPPRISARGRSRRCATPTRRSPPPSRWPAGGCMSTTEAAAAEVTPASVGRATGEGELDDEAARRRQGTSATAAGRASTTAGDDAVGRWLFHKPPIGLINRRTPIEAQQRREEETSV
jgi:hypothetical protein